MRNSLPVEHSCAEDERDSSYTPKPRDMAGLRAGRIGRGAFDVRPKRDREDAWTKSKR